jgi:hypothetical protein
MVSVVLGGGGGVALVSVVVTSTGLAGALDGCALGSCVESVVTSVTGCAAGFAAVGGSVLAAELEFVGEVTAALGGTAVFAFLER